jgi:peptide/nickel transport system substrate-binding protein
MPLLKKVLPLAMALSCAALALDRCSPAGKPQAKEKSPPIRIQAFILPQPRSLIPREGYVWVDGQFTELIFNNLVKAKYLGNLAPELAENWTISPDHREYIFHLKHNVHFHNGSPFTAADVVFTLEELIRKAAGKIPEIKCIDGYQDFLDRRSDHVRGLQVLDDHTLRILLNRNFKFFLQFLAAEYTAIVPRGYAGLEEEAFRKRPIGTGPFRLAASEPRTLRSQEFTVFRLERVPDYFAPTGNVGGIDFYSANTAIPSPCKEAFDVLYISNREINEMARKPDYRIINSSYNIINFLVLNPSENDQVRERKVRQLINYAINREDLARTVFHHKVLPAHTIMPYGLLGHNPYYRLDYSRAEKIRAELPAGKIRFSILTPTDERQRVAEYIARTLARFDIEVLVIPVANQYDYWSNRIYQTRTSVMLGAIPDYPASYHFLTHLVEPNGYYNIFGFVLPELKARIDSLPSSDTMEETRTLAEINTAFEAESLFIPLYYNSNFAAIRSRISAAAFNYGEIIDFAGLEVAE